MLTNGCGGGSKEEELLLIDVQGLSRLQKAMGRDLISNFQVCGPLTFVACGPERSKEEECQTMVWLK